MSTDSTLDMLPLLRRALFQVRERTEELLAKSMWREADEAIAVRNDILATIAQLEAIDDERA